MREMGLNEVRERFLSFFESKEHLRLKSYSLVPQGDKSLLLINSGMAPMKAYFTGLETPPSKRVTTCQKCIRTGDIENVGKTARHGTYFEMLGNFSFGDYFKEEIIAWAWEFCKDVMEIPVERMFVSVYEEDDEAYEIWNKKIGLDESKIFRMGKEDNFWEVGVGPCGPSSEIYYDKGEEYGCGEEGCTVGCDCDRYMEFWNLVFTQFEKTEDGEYVLLKNPNIDTGMGLERIASMMQNVDTIFDIDTLRAILNKVCEISGYEYGSDKQKDVSVRIITDHIRSVTFMTADGILPSNEGRGYVLRRLLRRATIHGKKLGINHLFMADIANVVIENSKDAYPELQDKYDYIIKVITMEEKRFYDTIDQGLEILKTYINEVKKQNKKVLDGESSFKMYDTFGFPIDLMKEILEEEQLTVDEDAFNVELEKQRNRAREAREVSTYMGADANVYDSVKCESTVFVGYDKLVGDSNVLALIANNEIVQRANAEDDVIVFVDKSTFYAESGGQRGDIGTITCNTGTVKVQDTKKVVGNKFAHVGIVVDGYIEVGSKAVTEVDSKNRMSSARNHTATHLLQKALKEVLGNHIEQSGSDVSADRLRFDFTHFSPMTSEEIARVEDIVNDKILENLQVDIKTMNIDDARAAGATALFGEKYGTEVRVVNASGYSIELCGGTHVTETALIGTFKLLSETGVSAGVRRIEALTGVGARNYYKQQDNTINTLAQTLKAGKDDVVKKVEAYISETKELNKKLEQAQAKMSLGIVDEILKDAIDVNGVTCVISKVDNMDGNGLKTMGDQLKDKLEDCAVVLVGVKDDKISIVAMASDTAVSKGVHSGNIVKDVASVLGGKGGGRPNMAQAGGVHINKISDGLEKAKEIISGMVK